mmetsp:Transcript_83958/g.148485  ORF Transcript_83958/g.148485 Transcript_83958/m.148485 type:complete len:555 (-) Transcript_83958:94-1758(-)
MPLDKSRIQGFGSAEPEPASSSFWGSTSWSTEVEKPQENKAEPKKCPAGHTLVLWNAKPGWCDGCGSKIKSGQPVMDCRTCNYYLCSSCAPQDAAEEPSFWGALADSWSTPAVDSAFDNVALRFGDVLDAAKQDMNDMANDISSFVAGAIGFDEEEDEEQDPEKQASAVKKIIEKVSPRSRQEAVRVIGDFCEKYPASRVRPSTTDLEKLWAEVSTLKAAALVSAIYDQLSYANGDTSWQPRLRILYAIESFFKKGGMGKEVAVGVYNQARSIIQHLVEVQQCAEKAFEVKQLLTGKIKVADPGAQADDEGQGAAAKAKATPKAKAEPEKEAPDLLDMADPVTAPTSTAPSGSIDLLGGASPAANTSLEELDFFATPAASSAPATSSMPAPSSTAAAADAFNPNQSTAMPSALNPGPAFPAFGAMSAPTGVPSGAGFGAMGMPAMGQGFGAPADPFAGMGSTSTRGAAMGQFAPFGSAPAGMGGYGGVTASMAGGFPAREPPPALNLSAYDSNGSPSKGGLPYIPAPKELTPVNSNAPVDPFAFVGDIVGDAKK